MAGSHEARAVDDVGVGMLLVVPAGLGRLMSRHMIGASDTEVERLLASVDLGEIATAAWLAGRSVIRAL